jgi:hypothetical protein
MEDLTYVETDVKKELYKTKAIATYNHIEDGKAYYDVEYKGVLHQFPLDLFETKKVSTLIGDGVVSTFDIQVPAADMNGASFGQEVRGSELNRWIARAIKTGNFIKIG